MNADLPMHGFLNEHATNVHCYYTRVVPGDVVSGTIVAYAHSQKP